MLDIKKLIKAKLNKEESNKNVGKKINGKVSLKNRFVLGGVTLALAASLIGCGPSKPKEPEKETYNYSPIIHNIHEGLHEDSTEFSEVMRSVEGVMVLDSGNPKSKSEVDYYGFYHQDVLGTLLNDDHGVIRGYLPTGEYVVQFREPRLGYGSIYIEELEGKDKLYPMDFRSSMEDGSIYGFIGNLDEIKRTVKFAENQKGNLILFLDVQAIRDYMKLKNRSMSDDPEYTMPTPINTPIEEAYEFKQLEIEGDAAEYDYFEGFDDKNYYIGDSSSFEIFMKDHLYSEDFGVFKNFGFTGTYFEKIDGKYQRVIRINHRDENKVTNSFKIVGDKIEAIPPYEYGYYSDKKRYRGQYFYFSDDEIIIDLATLMDAFEIDMNNLTVEPKNLDELNKKTTYNDKVLKKVL